MWFWVLAYLFLAFGVFLILAFANCLPGAVRVNWEWRPQMLGFAPSPVILSPTNYYKDIDIFLLILFYFEILISSFWMKYPATKIYSYLNIPRYCPHTNKQWRYLYFLFKNDVLPPRKYVYIHQSNQKIDDNLKKLNTSALYPLKQWPLIATFFVGLLQVDKQNKCPSDFDQQDLHRAICWSQRGHQPVWASHPRQVTDLSSLLQKDTTHFLLLTPTLSNLFWFFFICSNLAHAIGHNLGFGHDDSPGAQGGDDDWLMIYISWWSVCVFMCNEKSSFPSWVSEARSKT